MEGGFYLVQHADGHAGERAIRGIEYIGYDENTQTVRSHFMDVQGANLAYTWEIAGDVLKVWLGGRESETRLVAQFSPDRDSYSGRCEWPGGGCSATATRVRG